MIGGIISGIAEYTAIDPLLLRLAALLLLVLNPATGIIYIACLFIFPEYEGERVQPPATDNKRTGWLLIGFGALLIIRNFFPQVTLRMIIALLFIAAGIYLIVKRKDE